MRRKDLTTSEARTWCDEHRCKAPPGMLNQNEHVCVEKCPLTMTHVANAAAAATEEQEGRPLLRSRDDSASVVNAPRGRSEPHDARSYPRSSPQRRGPEQDIDEHEDWSVQQTTHST